MRVLVTGSTGLVGTALAASLTSSGHEVVPMVRRPAGANEVHWDPAAGVLDPADLEGADAVVHLAGENVAGGRWNAARKKRIRDSRVNGTRLLAEAIVACKSPPPVLVSASAIGFYGDRGAEELDEDAAPGAGFLPGVCRDWEAEAAKAGGGSTRLVLARIGVVLSPLGGALAKMLPPFRLGAGGVLGTGSQYMSWISLDDVVGGLLHCVHDSRVAGVVNLVAPGAVTNRVFTKTLGRVLGRPTLLPMPAFAARLAFGEMAEALLLASTRVRPDVLESAGYAFRHPELEGALRSLLGR